MLITNSAEARRLARARAHPSLSLTAFSAAETLADVRTRLFPELSQQVDLYFVTRGPLACVYYEDSFATIYVHQLLNHGETPLDVMRLICKHELLHLRIPPAVKHGKEVYHPPEFWEAERAMCPERRPAWAWIWMNLAACLKRRPRKECIDVLLNWKQVWNEPKLDLAVCQKHWKCDDSAEDEEAGW